ncbi:hypothetical protein TNIN_295871 [Trichonephila inaurata madagascariensis]|uniref:Uncharacterized protein n=1 Tax=Trichonephila inaurata madagascariensis TaxID=2747483 RepID=A0A8X6Y4Z1_9ARAC|nr:hypothetical protein TNIN_295871 [Trichonephila inaurata madagascariensis]
MTRRGGSKVKKDHSDMRRTRRSVFTCSVHPITEDTKTVNSVLINRTYAHGETFPITPTVDAIEYCAWSLIQRECRARFKRFQSIDCDSGCLYPLLIVQCALFFNPRTISMNPKKI